MLTVLCLAFRMSSAPCAMYISQYPSFRRVALRYSASVSSLLCLWGWGGAGWRVISRRPSAIPSVGSAEMAPCRRAAALAVWGLAAGPLPHLHLWLGSLLAFCLPALLAGWGVLPFTSLQVVHILFPRLLLLALHSFPFVVISQPQLPAALQLVA